ncbi:ABC transporter substrate-binding protein [Vibrio nigripulchritudo]|uniref:ABC transporter substrate-binding protein n=1 Tax=Vibrio nigripulchritudo TaxID=28173 RepID=UPI0003B1F732|nr:sugar ABC transporter substrate-binding protein [Vibrio nigripulchritudo]CCN68500.1 putative Sugar ABC transporter [Vibrio nigripulchritudo SFn118]
MKSILRSICTLLLAAAAALPVTAEEKIELKWQMWGGNANKAMWEEIASLVNEKHPNISVKLELSGWSDYWNRLPVLAASGQIGDIIAIQSMRLPRYYPAMMPLNGLIEKDNFSTEPFESSIIDGLSYEGDQYALPYDLGPWVMFYNADRFEEAGLELPTSDWTFDDFRAAAKKMTDDDKWGFALQNLDFVTLSVAQGADYMDKNNEFDVANAGYRAAVQNIVDLVVKDKVSPLFTSARSDDSARSRFTSGNAAMMIDGPWIMVGLKDQVDFKMGVATLPSGDKGTRALTAGSGFGISAQTPHKEAAFKALKVITGPEAAKILASAGRALPGRTAEQKYWLNNAADGVLFASESLDQAFSNSSPVPINDGWHEFQSLISQYIPLALTEEETVESVLNNIQNQLP